MSLLLLALLSLTVDCFYIKISDSGLDVQTGASFTLLCSADQDYEYCRFKSPTGSTCDFEWKYKTGNVSLTSCPHLRSRAHFTGSYRKKECGLTVSGARLEDAGYWECQVEQYKLGLGRGAGTLRIGEFHLTVSLPTTTSTATTVTVTTTFT